VNNVSHTVEIDGENIPYTCKEILLKPTTAEVLCRNEENNPVLLKNKYGKGKVYFLNIPAERLAIEKTDGFNVYPYYKIYKEVAKDVIRDKEIRVDNKNIGVTINSLSSKESYVTLLNYSDTEIKSEFVLNDEWEIKEVIYGDLKCIPACDGIFMKINKK